MRELLRAHLLELLRWQVDQSSQRLDARVEFLFTVLDDQLPPRGDVADGDLKQIRSDVQAEVRRAIEGLIEQQGGGR